MIEITKDIFICKEDVSSIQREVVHDSSSPSGGSIYASFEGSVITLKNGRKIFVPGLTPTNIRVKLEGV